LQLAANTVSRESFGHINVLDVDTGIGDGLFDGAIQEGCGRIDLGLNVQVRIAWDKLKQERIACDHDKSVRRRSCHRSVQVCEAIPELTVAYATSW
jgi:hypothetical protein